MSKHSGVTGPSRKFADRPHGPENAEHELEKAYNHVIEAAVSFYWDRNPVSGVNPDDLARLYRKAYDAYRDGDRLGAERWARAAKHLSRAFWHEAKLAYFEPRTNILPYLSDAAEEYDLVETPALTNDLLNSLEGHVPPGLLTMPEEIKHYLLRGRKHLAFLSENKNNLHELAVAERIKAAHEYGRVVECLALGYEAEAKFRKKAA